MDPGSATASPAPTWRRAVRRRALEGAEGPELGRRAEELEEAVRQLRAELDAERGAAETAASEAMTMIARLQREKAAALIEAREFRRLAEGRAGRDRELQDELAAVSALAASYAALLRAHGVDPEEEESGGNHDDEEDERPVGHPEAEADAGGESRDGDVELEGDVVKIEKASPPPPSATNAVVTAAGEERTVDVARGRGLHARVEALEADSVAVRREVAALRAERAQVVLAREVVRRLCREAAAARNAVVVAERPRFSVLAICKWFFSTIIWGTKRSASSSSSSGSSTAILLAQLLLLERSKGGHRRIQSSPAASGNHMPAAGETGLACCERPWCSPL